MNDSKEAVKRDEGDIALTHDPRRLRWRRIAAGLSLTAAANGAGYSKPHLSELEHGVGGASAECLAAFARLYGCEITDLMPVDPGLAGAAAERMAG